MKTPEILQERHLKVARDFLKDIKDAESSTFFGEPLSVYDKEDVMKIAVWLAQELQSSNSQHLGDLKFMASVK